MNDRPDVCVVMVAWNSAQWIAPCLDALVATDYEGQVEAVVVDNASDDDSASIAESHSIGARAIRNADNRGFGGGCNDGWRAGGGEIVVFLNLDTEVRPDWLTPIVETFASENEVAIIGSKLLLGDNGAPARRAQQFAEQTVNAVNNGATIQHAGGVVYPNAMADHIGAGTMDDGQFDAPRNVDYVTGAALAIRRDRLEAIGGFDERFHPAYYEETDLCAEARARGWRVRYEPRSVIVHHEASNDGDVNPRFLELFTRGRMRYAMKRFTAADWLCRFLPFELKWMRAWPATGVRRAVVKSYFRR